jgi:uncharacterized protein YndB with AHSA1/START domain
MRELSLNVEPALACTREPQPAAEAAGAREPVGWPLAVRVRRTYEAPRDVVFAAWMSRQAWSTWMQLRARSRATVAARVGGAYRLEIADGPIIHVITGTIEELRPEERLALTWLHHDMANEPSLVEVSLRSVAGGTELALVHRRITARRQLAWTRSAWERMLERLAKYLAPARPTAVLRRCV